MNSKYGKLFKDANVRRWHDNIARGSKITADVYLRRLGNFCKANKLTPKNLAAMGDRRLHDLMLDFVTLMEKRGHTGSYVESVLKALKSWLAHNRRELKGKIKISGARDTPSLKDERVPTKDELKKIFLSGDKKARVACVLVAHSGLRIETLGNYSGDDGLRIKDLPELAVDGGIKFKQFPAMVIVRKELSKARHQYFTFLGEEGCGYLKDYLEERVREGEELTSESPIITPKFKMKPFIRAINVGDAIRGAIRKAGFRWRPYVLRSFFDTELMLAESKGLVVRDYRTFWMGHKGDIENRYTTNKGRLPQEVIEDMREAYRKSQDYLQTTKPEATSAERLREEFRKQLLLAAGFTPEEVEKIDLYSLGDEEFQAMIRQKLLGVMQNNGTRQRVVPADEIEKYITQGWEFVATLPNGKAVLKLPF